MFVSWWEVSTGREMAVEEKGRGCRGVALQKVRQCQPQSQTLLKRYQRDGREGGAGGWWFGW